MLKARWTASPSPIVAFYRIYKKQKVVEEIPVGSALQFETSLESKKAAKVYSVAAVGFEGLESERIKIRIVHESE